MWNSVESMQIPDMFTLSFPRFSLILLFIVATGLPLKVYTDTPPTQQTAKNPANNRMEVENDWIKLVAIPRTAEQMSAFYEGRGFSKQARQVISEACFITFGMRNLSKDILWLDLDNWQIQHQGKTLKHYTRDHWKNQWQEHQVPLAHQATFNWTQLPQRRDLHPEEPVGGNLTLAPVSGSISIILRFTTGPEQKGPVKTIKLDNLKCAKTP